MNTPKLPPLPEPVDELCMDDGFNVIGTQPVFTAEQMQACARAAIQAQGVPDVVQEWKSGVISAQDAMLKIASTQQAKPRPLSDEQSRELAEQHYMQSSWFDNTPVTVIGSRQWCAYWDGWRAAHGIVKE